MIDKNIAYGLIFWNFIGLMILETKEEHAGIWICEAENNAGKNQLDITLDVWSKFIWKPIFYLLYSFIFLIRRSTDNFAAPPVVAISPNDTLRALDTPITLYCEATGNPEPSLSWSKEGQPLISSVEGECLIHSFVKGQRWSSTLIASLFILHHSFDFSPRLEWWIAIIIINLI